MILRDRDKLKEQRRSAVQLDDSLPGLASDYIRQLVEYLRLHPDVKAVLPYIRVSERFQEWRNNPDDQEAAVLRALEPLQKQYGFRILKAVRCQEHGWELDAEGRKGFVRAVRRARKMARKLGGTVVIVAEGTSRYIRSKQGRNATPTVSEFRKLQKLARGVPLTTIFPPDTPWKNERGEQTKRGQRTKGKGGRPRKKKMDLLACHLRDAGCSLAEIADFLKRRRSTVQRWLMDSTGSTKFG